MDVSFLIPARNEMFLEKTVESILSKIRADSEVIVVLDGAWPDSPLFDHPRLRVTHSDTVIGQRAATNLAARMSTATYVCKIDAHCDIDEGFDAKLIAADQEIGRPDLTQIPAMYNLRAFQWKCGACGKETYQGPTPTSCACGTAGPFTRVIYWDRLAGGREREIRTEFWRFDHELHFQYWNGHDFRRRPSSQGDLVDVMSSIGACFFMRRERFFEIGGLDERHGSWGQFGTEIACKSWLSGGRHIVNKRTWFAHLFRTQGADFGMPYPLGNAAVQAARAYSRKLWIDGTWPGAKYPLSWLIEKFAPVPDWTPERIAALQKPNVIYRGDLTTVAEAETEGRTDSDSDDVGRTGTGGSEIVGSMAGSLAKTKGCAYYSDLRGDPAVLTAVREQLARAAAGLPIVSATLGRLDFGTNLVPRQCAAVDCRFISWTPRRPRQCPKCGATGVAGYHAVFNTLERGYITMFRQQLAALEALDTDIAFMTEHDVLYSPTHFTFTPPRDDTFYYNQNTWRVNGTDGRALFYYCNQVSGLCASRALLVDHYRKRVAYVEEHGFDRSIGFEPGGNAKVRALFGGSVETWMSDEPNVDIKTEHCLTKGRWSQEQFRNKSTCQGWQEADAVPGWGITRDRVDAFLGDVAQGALSHA